MLSDAQVNSIQSTPGSQETTDLSRPPDEEGSPSWGAQVRTPFKESQEVLSRICVFLSHAHAMLMAMVSGSDRKGRGAFYTPPEMVTPMVRWAVRGARDTVLDGGAGESVFLVAAARRLLELGIPRQEVLGRIFGVELDELAAELAAKSLAALVDADPEVSQIKRGSFFDQSPGELLPPVSACIGNPPYIRYQSFAGAIRKRALSRAAEGGVKLNGLTSSWAPFLVHACQFVAPGGRFAQVLPAELLHTGYAQPIRDFLIHRFRSVLLVAFDARVFPGALEEVVLVLAEDDGPEGLQVREAADIRDLDRVIRIGTLRQRSIRRPKGKWSKYLLQHSELRTYETIGRDDRVTRLGSYGTTDIGVVTGANNFFVLANSSVVKADLPMDDLLPAICKAEHVQGLRLGKRDLNAIGSRDEPCLLFYPLSDELQSSTARYIRSGEWIGLHNRYKCRTRQPWWRVPGVKVPDMFITYMSNDVPRMVVNDAGATSTNTVHRFFINRGGKRLRKLLPILALNSLTLLSAEIEGRSYGGGVLKLEPKECDRLLVPRVEDLPQELLAELLALFADADASIREGHLLHVVEQVDEIVLSKALEVSAEEIERLRNARARLHGRRTARMRSRPG